MKFTDVLRGYVSYAEPEVTDIWAKADFCLDTNVLLNAYRYTKVNSLAFCKLLIAIKGRLFVPHQVALEFARNRVQVIRGHYRPHRSLRTALDRAEKAMTEEFRKHPDLGELCALIALTRTAIDDRFGDAEKAHMGLISDDVVLQQVLDIIGTDVGESYPRADLDKEYKRRKDGNIPPFCKMDDDKDEERRMGDLALWLELLKKYEGSGKPLIFVTDDTKENWWLDSGAGRHDPQPSLVQEVYQRTGADVLFYTADRFSETAQTRLGIDIGKTLADETRQIQQRENESRAQRRRRLARLLIGQTPPDDFDVTDLPWPPSHCHQCGRKDVMFSGPVVRRTQTGHLTYTYICTKCGGYNDTSETAGGFSAIPYRPRNTPSPPTDVSQQ